MTKYIKTAIWLCTGLAFLGCLVTASASFVPFEWIKVQLDALAVDGDAEKFTHPIFTKIVSRLQLASIGLLLVSTLLFFRRNTLRRRLESWLQDISFFQLFAHLKSHLQKIWTESDPTHRYIVCIVILLGIIIRTAFLFQPMRHDEAFTFTNYASKPILLALSNYSFPNNHLFHTLLVHIVYLCFGNHEWIIRLPAFLAGILVLPTTYLVIRKLYTPNVALITTVLVATSSSFVEYSTNARGYMLICLFFWVILALAHHLVHTIDKTAWLCISILGALGLYTVPIMVYPLALTFGWILISLLYNPNHPNPKRQIIHLIISGIGLGIITIILYTPVFLGSGPGALFSNRFVKSAPTWISLFAGLQHSSLELWRLWTWDYFVGLPQLALLMLAFGLVSYQKHANHHIPLPISISICLLLIIIQRVTPPERIWLFLLPLFFAWIAIGIAQTIDLLKQVNGFKSAPKYLPLIITLIIIGTSLPGSLHNLAGYYQYGPGTMRDAEQMTKELSDYLEPGDRVLTIATAAPIEYYFNRNNLSIQYLRTPVARANRLILIVMESKYSLDEVLELSRIPKTHFSPPLLWQRYKSAAFYILIRNPVSKRHNLHQQEKSS